MNCSETSLESDGIERPLRRPRRKSAARKRQQRLVQLLEQEWPELPYIMMRMTATARPQSGRRFYWRDQCVHCGGIELNLTKSSLEDGTSVYTAIYSRDDEWPKGSRHDYLVPLQPSVEERELRWVVPALCGTTKLGAEELAQVLLAQLGILKATEFAKPTTNHFSSDGPASPC